MAFSFGFGRRNITAIALSCALLTASLLSPKSSRALTFNFTALDGTSQQAIDGFTAAGNIWSSFLTDNVTINITIGFSSLGSNILAQAESTTQGFTYNAVRNALISDATSALDATAVANLQTGNSLQFLTNNTSGAVVLDNNNSANNLVLDINTANAKALGLISGTSTAQDAIIQFSSDFSFDFDRSDGINSGSYDFIGLAMHEIGHSLGFVSGVDVVDYFSGPNTGFDENGNRVSTLDLNGYRVFTTLDLFRYSSSSTTVGSLGYGLQDLTQGSASYFSVDKGITNLGAFSTGLYDGDGRQASHWKDDQGLGIMDPTAGGGEFLMLTSNDLRAFDAIGWNLASTAQAPEPSALNLLCGTGLLLGGIQILRRRRKRAN